MLRRSSGLWFACLGFALLAPPVQAGAVTTIHFELEEIGAGMPEPVDGISVAGVTFGFALGGMPSAAALYGAPGPDASAVAFLQGRVLEGDPDGELTIDFDPPVGSLELAVALPTIGTLVSALQVDVFAPDLTPLGSFDVDLVTQPGKIWAENVFAFAGSEVGQVRVAFAGSVTGDPFITTFWLDELTFPEAPSAPVPSLGPWGVALLALALLVAGRLPRLQRSP